MQQFSLSVQICSGIGVTYNAWMVCVLALDLLCKVQPSRDVFPLARLLREFKRCYSCKVNKQSLDFCYALCVL